MHSSGKIAALVALGALTVSVQATLFTTTSDRRVLTTSSPVYPSKARDARIEGDVTVCYTIDSKGRVRRPYVESSSNRVFNRAARKAAKAIAYAPAKPGAANNVAPACSTYRFRLNSLRDATS
ncbi:MAG: TonB family protein [Gammaproteobacteria bacterium]